MIIALANRKRLLRNPGIAPLVKFFTIALAGTRVASHGCAIVRPMTASVPFFSLLLGVSACGPRLANRNIEALNAQFQAAEKSGKNLSLKEVEAILGHPTREESFPIEIQTTRELQGVRYYYQVGGQTVELHFIDNKLIRRVPRPGEAASESDRRTMPKTAPATPAAAK